MARLRHYENEIEINALCTSVERGIGRRDLRVSSLSDDIGIGIGIDVHLPGTGTMDR